MKNSCLYAVNTSSSYLTFSLGELYCTTWTSLNKHFIPIVTFTSQYVINHAFKKNVFNKMNIVLLKNVKDFKFILKFKKKRGWRIKNHASILSVWHVYNVTSTAAVLQTKDGTHYNQKAIVLQLMKGQKR